MPATSSQTHSVAHTSSKYVQHAGRSICPAKCLYTKHTTNFIISYQRSTALVYYSVMLNKRKTLVVKLLHAIIEVQNTMRNVFRCRISHPRRREITWKFSAGASSSYIILRTVRVALFIRTEDKRQAVQLITPIYSVLRLLFALVIQNY